MNGRRRWRNRPLICLKVFSIVFPSGIHAVKCLIFFNPIVIIDNIFTDLYACLGSQVMSTRSNYTLRNGSHQQSTSLNRHPVSIAWQAASASEV
ncbi:hypothetical protein EDB82DRAFT_205924 [Fusarium venenatum]|uniref:uncharacterized protein n=1 Tax=Fusarium venenatum TaxID=56646 RepID=UPI001DFE92DE|nr:hypothetical protein EDB82DRAFT_205924 [Fusarium venenatum]